MYTRMKKAETFDTVISVEVTGAVLMDELIHAFHLTSLLGVHRGEPVLRNVQLLTAVFTPRLT